MPQEITLVLTVLPKSVLTPQEFYDPIKMSNINPGRAVSLLTGIARFNMKASRTSFCLLQTYTFSMSPHLLLSVVPGSKPMQTLTAYDGLLLETHNISLPSVTWHLRLFEASF